MHEMIQNFHTQFSFTPQLVYGDQVSRAQHIIVGGMGGSRLAAGIIAAHDPSLDIHVHMDYGVPILRGERVEEHLLIASSYSGETEETIDFAKNALERHLPLAILTSGGTLLALANKHHVPHVVLPKGLAPRIALGFSSLGLAALMKDERLMHALASLAHAIHPTELESEGEKLAHELQSGVVLYGSSTNRVVVENWKIAFNETAKVPAFWNIFPEVAHNEIEIFDGREAHTMHPVFFDDEHDHMRVVRRMQVTRALLETRGVSATSIVLRGTTFLERAFTAIVLGHWTALYIAQQLGHDPERVPLIEELKARMK